MSKQNEQPDRGDRFRPVCPQWAPNPAPHNWFRPRLSLSLHATCASTCASANSLLKQHVAAATRMPAELRLTLDGECTEAVNSPAVVLQ